MRDDVLIRHQVHIRGKGSTCMIFTHGFGCDQTMWRFVAPAFEDRWRVVTYDLAGFGKSGPRAVDSRRHGTLDGYAEDLLEICEALDASNAVFVGHSVGAMIGILASIRQPERFSRLILIGPSPCYINELPDYIGGFERQDIEELLKLMDENYTAWAHYLAPVITGNPERPAIAQELEHSFCSVAPEIARQFAHLTFLGDNRGDLPKVTVPALIMQCDQDVIAPLEVGSYIHHRLHGSTLVFMDAVGHCPHLSHPEETIQQMNAYLSPDISDTGAGGIQKGSNYS